MSILNENNVSKSIVSENSVTRKEYVELSSSNPCSKLIRA